MPTPPHDDPFAWFDAWFTEASQQVSPDPNAMALGTVAADGTPDVRVVLLKTWDERGFVFYTNRESAKGLQLASSPHAALNFYWRPMGRQVRIRGSVTTVSDEESDEYFATRDRASQIGAWASHQSTPLDSWEEFDGRVAKITAEFEGEDVPRPPHWGGYRVAPESFEFWRSGEFRLHERWQFVVTDGQWRAGMLYP